MTLARGAGAVLLALLLLEPWLPLRDVRQYLLHVLIQIFVWAFIGTAQQIVDKLGAFTDIGVDYFAFEIIGLPDPEAIRMVVEDVLPKVR